MLESFLYFEKDFNIETIVRDIFVLDILNRMDGVGDCSQCDQIGPLLKRLGVTNFHTKVAQISSDFIGYFGKVTGC